MWTKDAYLRPHVGDDSYLEILHAQMGLVGRLAIGLPGFIVSMFRNQILHTRCNSHQSRCSLASMLENWGKPAYLKMGSSRSLQGQQEVLRAGPRLLAVCDCRNGGGWLAVRKL